MSARIAALAATFALVLTGCTPAKPGEVYQRPLADARRVVLATELPLPLLGTTAAKVRARPQADDTIELAIIDGNDGEQLRYTAALTAEGAGATRVFVDYAGPGADNLSGTADGRKYPEIIALFLKAMREQVDAQLEDRTFNYAAIGPELILAMGRNAAATNTAMTKAADADRRRYRDNIDAAYADEARGER